MFISLWIDYQRLMETFSLFILPKLQKICICTFSINADMQSRQNSKRFNWTSYLYYTYFLLNIYWHFIQKIGKIPKTYAFWGLKSVFDTPSVISCIVSNPYFPAFSRHLFITCLLPEKSHMLRYCFIIHRNHDFCNTFSGFYNCSNWTCSDSPER